MYFTYILYSESADKYYVGQTNDVDQRLTMHNTGRSAFTAPFAPWNLMIAIEKPTRSEAMALERKLKNLSKDRILKFINKYT